MKTKKLSLALFIGLSVIIVVAQSHASDEDLFSVTVPPDVLIVLDMSGSMNWDIAGNGASYPNRRIDIARNVIFDLLDDDDSGKNSNNDVTYIDSDDEQGLNVRLGYMRFREIGDNDDGDPFGGKIKIFTKEGEKPSTEIGVPYADIWTRISDAAETATGCTPLGAALVEAKKYIKDHVNPKDDAVACRQKSIILVTDGSDTIGCDGDCSEDASDMWRRRMLTVQRSKEANDAKMQVFTVGFGGDFPDNLKKTLNWAAKYGGTDNPSEENSDKPGDPIAYDIKKYIPKDVDGNDLDACSTDASLATQADPATYPLSGYAFLADNAEKLTEALKTILKNINSQPFYFASPTIPSVRLSDEEGQDNVVYISSFVPGNTPFWKGSLKKYLANPDGTVPVDENGNPLKSNLKWEASDQLKNTDANSRNIKTFVNGAMTSFTYDNLNLTNADLDVASDEDREDLINHIRGGVDAYDVNGNRNTRETREWKLGDIFHSNAVVVGSPSIFFEAPGFSGAGGFYEKNKNRTKVIFAGANDGMLHAFNAGTGNEEWAFIPNSLLKTLKLMKTAHTYYVDGSPKVVDVWFDSNNDNMKVADEWRTVLVCGLRKGGKHYFALDITDTLNPKFLWEFPKTPEVLNKVGESWSDPAIGKVMIEQGSGLVEKWVAFIGGGYDPNDQKKDREATTGNVFFVIDIMTGEIIKEFSGLDFMRHSFPAPPTTFDGNSDGYVDKVYIGDLGGQMWVFDVSFNGLSKKSNSQWNGKRLFKAPKESSEKHNIYYQPAVAFDEYGIPWVYFGTGDREDPTDAKNPQERFYGVMDDGKGDYPRTENDLRNVTNLFTFSPDRTRKGWFIKLEKGGKRLEKVSGKPSVFNKLLYFTTYFYDDKAEPCSVAGDARLYVVEYVSAGGAFDLGDYLQRINPEQRWEKIGSGVASSPMITMNMKGRDSVIAGTTTGQVYSTKAHSPSTLKETLYWREIIPE